uniref:Uncharacterized protein n=1 Tax=Guillardia theta TaxID=55529 RepID=A0A7S4P9Y4_GUITH
MSLVAVRMMSNRAAALESWHTLTPSNVRTERAKFAFDREKDHLDHSGRHRLKHFFGLQHFPGHALAKQPRSSVLRDKNDEAGASKLTDAAYMQKLAQERNFRMKNGYFDSNSYAETLMTNAKSEQAAYMKNWHKKNRIAAKAAVKDASVLYKKWMLIDPYTGRSKSNMVVPQEKAATQGMRKQQLLEVTADNDVKYNLPWWCVVEHPEVNGAGKGWDGAVTPAGKTGPGVDCSFPGTGNAAAYRMQTKGTTEQLSQIPSRRTQLLEWRHTMNARNYMNRPGSATSVTNSDGPEYNVMADNFQFPDY